MVVEKYQDHEIEITEAALEVRDTDGSEHAFNLVAIRYNPYATKTERTWICFGNLRDALAWIHGRSMGAPRIKDVGEHDLINLQRLAEQAFTFQELKQWWKERKSQS